MATTCLETCPDCRRHVRCGERACPFCGARVTTVMHVLEYRLQTRLSRGWAASMGAALTAAGFVMSCEENGGPLYGAPCAPTCVQPDIGGSAGSGGSVELGGAAGEPGAVGDAAGAPVAGGAAGGGGEPGDATGLGGAAGSAGEGGAGGSG
jgi:hypothetical protein